MAQKGSSSMTALRRFIKDETGATAIEYGLIAAVLSLAIIAGFTVFSNQLQTMLGTDFVNALNSH
jgi:pilus assembly protein Flp/PilA